MVSGNLLVFKGCPQSRHKYNYQSLSKVTLLITISPFKHFKIGVWG